MLDINSYSRKDKRVRGKIMAYGKCEDCEFNDSCRVVQEEVYEVGGKKTVIGVVECGHYKVK